MRLIGASNIFEIEDTKRVILDSSIPRSITIVMART